MQPSSGSVPGENPNIPAHPKVQQPRLGGSRDRIVVDKLPTVTGSIAGANSRSIQEYLIHSQREKDRIKAMEREAELEKQSIAFEEARLARKRALEEEAAKKRDRRNKRKHAGNIPAQPASASAQPVESPDATPPSADASPPPAVSQPTEVGRVMISIIDEE